VKTPDLERLTDVVLKVDVPDGQGDIFPREAVQKAIEGYREKRLHRDLVMVSEPLKRPSPIGFVEDIELKEDGDVEVTVAVLPEGQAVHVQAFKDGRANFSIVGSTSEKLTPRPEGGFVYDDFELAGIEFSYERVPLVQSRQYPDDSFDPKTGGIT
jgi:hypothetical protein